MLIAFVALLYAASAHELCNKRIVSVDGEGLGVICVCNATYCDELPSPPSDGIFVYSTSKDGDRLTRTQLKNEPKSTKSRTLNIVECVLGEIEMCVDVLFRKTPSTITVDPTRARQPLLGFGGALTDAAAINIKQLPASMAESLMASYFGENGIGYSLIRIPMASSDFSTRVYSYDDVPGDFALKHFALGEEDVKYKIPLIRMAQRLSPRTLKVFGSPWSPPAWMKTSGRAKGGASMIDSPLHWRTYAAYFARFIRAYEKRGVPVWAVTVQNEPSSGEDAEWRWQTLNLTCQQEHDFILNHLGPALNSTRTSIISMDDQRNELEEYAEKMYSDPRTARYVKGLGMHWYNNGPDASSMTRVAEKWPNKFILATEACNGYGARDVHVILGSWQRAVKYAKDIITDLNHYAVGWVDWNVALDTQGGPNWVGNFVDAPVIVNATAREFYKQPTFYILAHFSKFLRPRAVVVHAHIPPPLVGVAAVNTDGQRVLVVLNASDSALEFSVNEKGKKSTLRVPIKSHSVVTVVWPQ